MRNVLLASNTDTTRLMLCDLFQDYPLEKLHTSTLASECRKKLLKNDFDLLIIDSPLADEFGTDLALYAAEETNTGIMFICIPEKFDSVCSQVEEAGVFTLVKPANPEIIRQAARLLTVARKRVMNIKNKYIKLQHKIEELRLVDRAKCILIQYLNMTESQAHRYIEKQAMDFRQSKSTIAKKILQTYEM